MPNQVDVTMQWLKQQHKRLLKFTYLQHYQQVSQRNMKTELYLVQNSVQNLGKEELEMNEKTYHRDYG